MGRRAAIGLYICILALWTQLLVPVAALSMQSSVDPFAVVCSHGPAQDTGSDEHGRHGHACCVLCHAQIGLGSGFQRPPYTAFDYPVSSPLRWHVRFDAPVAAAFDRDKPARGPPRLV